MADMHRCAIGSSCCTAGDIEVVLGLGAYGVWLDGRRTSEEGRNEMNIMRKGEKRRKGGVNRGDGGGG